MQFHVDVYLHLPRFTTDVAGRGAHTLRGVRDGAPFRTVTSVRGNLWTRLRHPSRRGLEPRPA